MGVRNGKNYVYGLVLVAVTAVVTLAIGDVARTVKEAPVQNAIRAGEIESLRVQVRNIEQQQREFKKAVDQEFAELRADMKHANEKILRELERANAALRRHMEEDGV